MVEKTFAIKPIPKQGDHSTLDNYKAICIWNLLSKILASLVVDESKHSIAFLDFHSSFAFGIAINIAFIRSSCRYRSERPSRNRDRCLLYIVFEEPCVHAFSCTRLEHKTTHSFSQLSLVTLFPVLETFNLRYHITNS